MADIKAVEGFEDVHYEDEFEFPFWKLIRDYAEEHDLSYSKAARAVCSEYVKTIRYRDTEWSDEQIRKREREMVNVGDRRG